MHTSQQKRLWLIILITVVLAQLSCGTFQIIVQNQATLSSTIDKVTTITITPGSETTLTPISQNDSLSATPPATDTSPWFSPRISFYPEPDLQKSQRVFPQGIRQIFAIWDYTNMRPGLLVRREWYKDEELILTQQEFWDFSRYGSQGTIADITIHDFESGLKTGLYTLRLFINGQEQTLNTLRDQASFRIIEVKPFPPLISPDRKRLALVSDPRSMIIQDEVGQQNRVFVGQEIAGMAWFPDSQNIIVVNRDRTKQELNMPAEGIRDELWIINTVSGLRIRIATPEENLHMPVVSPDGHYIAAISGTGRLIACESDLSLALIELDAKLTRIAIHKLKDFSGFPAHEFEPIPVNHPSAPMPGLWQSANQFTLALKFPCSSGEIDGIYLLNLDTWQIERLR